MVGTSRGDSLCNKSIMSTIEKDGYDLSKRPVGGASNIVVRFLFRKGYDVRIVLYQFYRKFVVPSIDARIPLLRSVDPTISGPRP
jgi:hypothetical protein